MPEFIPEHVPSGLDDFTQGYLECVEWLLDEEVDRDKVRGFSRAAIKAAKADCRDFMQANAADLAIYYEESGRPESYAGHDFWLSRNGHGTGFWDRGNHPVFDRLQKAAEVYGGADPYVVRGWIYLT